MSPTRVEDARLGSFLQRDALERQGTRTVPSTCNPMAAVDPSGLLECNCKGQCGCLKYSEHLINRHVNKLIAKAKKQKDPGAFLLKELSSEETHKMLWVIRLSYTRVMKWIRDNFPEDRIKKSGKSWMADCIYVCNVTQAESPTIEIELKPGFCIGTDKVGHFFDVGHILWDISSQFSKEHALRFSEWTELLYEPPRGLLKDETKEEKIYEWLTTGQFKKTDPATGEQVVIDVAEWEGKWGGRTMKLPVNMVGPLPVFKRVQVVATSWADDAANKAGREFWKAFYGGALEEFRLCDYVDHSWVE